MRIFSTCEPKTVGYLNTYNYTIRFPDSKIYKNITLNSVPVNIDDVFLLHGDFRSLPLSPSLTIFSKLDKIT